MVKRKSRPQTELAMKIVVVRKSCARYGRAGSTPAVATMDDNDKRKRWEDCKRRHEKQQLEEHYIKNHGRIIHGYCPCCGGITELDGTEAHDESCIWANE